MSTEPLSHPAKQAIVTPPTAVAQRSLGRRLLYAIILVSAMFACLAALVQLWSDYRSGLSSIHQRMSNAALSSAPGLVKSLWDLNEDQSRAQLQGILLIPEVSQVRITLKQGEDPLIVGRLPDTSNTLMMQAPLSHTDTAGLTLQLGTLHITATTQPLRQQIIDKAWVILATQTLKTFAVSFFILLIIRKVVIHRLDALGAWVNQFSLSTLEQSPELALPPQKNQNDELDCIALAINKMQLRITDDLEEIENTQHQLRRSKEKYRRLIDNISGGFFLYSHDTQGFFTFVSPSIESVLGYEQDAFLTHFSTNMPQSPINDQAQQFMAMSLRGEKPPPYQLEVYHKNRDVHLLEVVEVPVMDGGQRVISIDGIARDITHRRHMEEAQRDKEIAEAANRTKSEFLAIMSHEIRTPLNGVLGMLEQLNRTRLDEQQSRQVRMIGHAATVLRALLTDILDISKMEAGQLVLDLLPCNLREIAQAAQQTFLSKAEEKGVALRVTWDTSLPPAVIGDSVRMQQILLNLISNAVKFTEQGEIVLSMYSQEISDSTKHMVHFQVTDSGIGIPEQEMPRLFDPFTQADGSLSRAHGGAGLGLAICKKLAQAMDGDVTAESQRGIGSTFHFWLPLQAVDHTTTEQQQPTPMPIIPTTSLSILLVEDDFINQQVAQEILQSAGHQVTVVGNGQEALDHYAQQAFDLILMDLRMPIMDGLQATQSIRNREQKKDTHIPIIGLTADVLSSTLERCRQVGMDDVMAKPVSSSEVQKLMEKLSSVKPPKSANPNPS
ncbi:ATP-binding protein [Magnetococcus sp. PR-3]|uniref:ATP-binding protein n=1 Tax=Magnetococcus sp. PR-3 TaxID=3120355 RepID=UPI002FCE5175